MIKTKVLKSLNEELKQVTFVIMQPGTDLHGDYTDEEEIRKAKESFNQSAQRTNLYHKVTTNSAYVIESYQIPCDITLNGHPVLKGSWLGTWQFNCDSLWEDVKSSKINGVSIGAMATVEMVTDED